MANPRPVQRKAWMISYPTTCPEACSLLREKCSELAIDEFYATSENGTRYALLHLDRKVRASAVERGLELLVGCGVTGVDLCEHGGGNSVDWFAVLERHLAEKDARVVAWTKPGKTRPILAANVVVVAEDPVAGAKRLRSNGPLPSATGTEEAALRELLAEKDRLLAAKDAKYEAALVEKDKERVAALVAKDGDMRLLLLKRAEEEDKLIESKEYELLSLRKRADQGDSVITRLTAEISNLEAKLASAAETEAELRRIRGDTSQRETMLVVDLNAERRRVRELLHQVQSLEARVSESVRSSNLLEQQRVAKILFLEGEVKMMRHEARMWEEDRERSKMELKSKSNEICAAQAKIRDLIAHNAVHEKLDTVATLTDESSKRLDLMTNAAQLVKKQHDFACKEWKRRTEMLRDELAEAKQEIELLKGLQH